MKTESANHQVQGEASQEQEPVPNGWKIAGVAARGLTIALFAVAGAFFDTGLGVVFEILLGTLLGVLAVVVFTILARGIAWAFGRFSQRFLITLGGVVGAVIFLRETRFLRGFISGILDISSDDFVLPTALSTFALLAFVLALTTLTGLAVFVKTGKFRSLQVLPKSLLVGLALSCITIDIILIWNLADKGSDPYQIEFKTLADLRQKPLELEDPAQPGQYTIETLTYGSGVNHRRPEFGDAADLKSRTVDGSKLLKDWQGAKKRMREWYWGFGLDKAPLNARVWTPVGQGPFPLVLIVHGNHTMEEYSDPGYAYLGELLASHGFIAVSIDENYLNATWSGDFRGKEMPARAWLLLEHLRLWRDWNKTPGHRFSGKVDLENIALVGHSRGGEAIAIAAAYNRLPFYPDDATLKFDYNFSIRSLVAIAQIDRRYPRRIELENINFLTLHGSYDSDEPAFHGLRQFNRIEYTDDHYWFKTGVYIHGANHGQFNSIWGREDSRPPNSWLLNLQPIIPGEDQRQVAKVYISAFLQATLLRDFRYLPLFQDARIGSAWLPDQIYVSQFADSEFQPIATFEEDLDVTTGTATGVILSAEGLSLWREEELLHRDKLNEGTSVAVLGWNRENEDSTASFTVKLTQNFEKSKILNEKNLLSFWVSGSTEKPPNPAKNGQDLEDADKEDENAEEEPQPPNFIIELVDSDGSAAQIAIRDIAALAPPLRVQVLKPKGLNRELYNKPWDPVLQTCELPFGRFTTVNPELDLSQIRKIRFRFDKSLKGVILLDNIGIRPAHRWTSASLK